jgi:hypothetical protein
MFLITVTSVIDAVQELDLIIWRVNTHYFKKSLLPLRAG